MKYLPILLISFFLSATTAAGEFSNFAQIPHWLGSKSTREKIQTLASERVENIPIPILFGVEVDDLTPNFGDPRGGGTRIHEGHDTHAPRMTPVVSPTEAVVLNIGNGANSGRIVYTANPGEETFVYMHLDKIASSLHEGDILARGDLIGYVGNTGNALHAGHHLHFEIIDGVPTDPLPRLTETFTLAEKARFLANLLPTATADYSNFASVMVENFADELLSIQALGLALPTEILGLLSGEIPPPPPPAAVTPNSTRDLTINSRGPAVVDLQKFLIAENSGPKTERLRNAGATGYFGSITRAALAEFQALHSISPAIGYYGPLTRAFIQNLDTTVAVVANTIPEIDLENGSRGNHVVWLQTYLINANIGGAAARLARAGATGYFGPITEAALAEFQKHSGISPAIGYYGPITRATIRNKS